MSEFGVDIARDAIGMTPALAPGVCDTFWSMDEGFAGPLHWGFVFFGWMTLGVFGVTLQMLARLRELMGPEACAVLLRRDI